MDDPHGAAAQPIKRGRVEKYVRVWSEVKNAQDGADVPVWKKNLASQGPPAMLPFTAGFPRITLPGGTGDSSSDESDGEIDRRAAARGSRIMDKPEWWPNEDAWEHEWKVT